MTNDGAGTEGSNTNQARQVAREKARQLRHQHRRRERRNRALLQGGLIVVALAIITGVTLVIVNSVRPPAPGPQNMLSDGIKIGQNFEAVSTSGLRAEQDPVPSERNAADVIDIQLYVDYFCPGCQAFENENAEQITTWLEEGAATIEIHPLALLDSRSAGTEYSTRAANAAACVAENSPNSFFEFNRTMFQEQPTEGEPGLSDEQLVAITEDVGVAQPGRVADCITSTRFKSWVREATARALNGPIPNSNVDAIVGTPTVIVNGEKYNYSDPFDATEFAQFVSQAAGSAFNESTTSTPTPATTP